MRQAIRKVVNRCGGVRNIVVWMTVIVIVPTLFFCFLQTKYHGVYSQFDEGTHISYAWSVAHGHIPARGDTVERPILDAWACSGQTNAELPPCGESSSPSQFPAQGQQYNFIHPPIYYIITGFLSRCITHFSHALTFAQAARLLQIVWVIFGMALCYAAFRRWDVPRLYAYSSVALIPFIPMVLNAGSAVTNDAPALACGAMLVWCAARVFKEHRCDAWPVAISIFFCLIKGTFAFGFLAFAAVMFFYSIIWLFTGDKKRGYRSVFFSCTIAVASMICVWGWSAWQKTRGVSNWHNPNEVYRPKMEGSPFWQWAKTAFSGLNLGSFTSAGRDLSDQPLFIMWAAILSIITLGAAAFLYFQHDGSVHHQALSATTFTSLALYPTLVQAREYLSSGLMFDIVTVRYGMCLIPLVLCCWAVSLQNRESRIIAIIIPIFGMICGFATLLSATNLT